MKSKDDPSSLGVVGDPLRDLIREMRSIAIAAGQASVEGPRDFLARQAAAEAGRCTRWADQLEALVGERRPQDDWQPIDTAPKVGRPDTILLWVPTLHGTGGPVLAHWAHGDGDGMMPPFGPSWFFWTGYHFSELQQRPTHWMPLPGPPTQAYVGERRPQDHDGETRPHPQCSEQL